ncbi:MAG: N-acetylglucosamine-6-phosphate deacetylase [Acidobacteriota bacterium]
MSLNFKDTAPKGFVDLQVNGYQGVDFSAPGLDLEQVRLVVDSLKKEGTIAFCPTIITSAMEIYEQNLPVLARAMDEPALAPHLLGIHVEGPFISPEDGARGAHPRPHTAVPDIALYDRLRHLAENRISLMTLAPELPGAKSLIQHIIRTGAAVSLGHHLANRQAIEEACECGAVAATHLGNGVPNLLPRHPNPLWDQLDEDRLTVMLITDGHHVPDTFIRVVTRLKGPQRLIVVSDSAPPAGLPPGRYHALGQDVVLEESGRLWNPLGNHLVGSSCCMMQCMNYLAKLGVFTEDELWQVGYVNPLALIGRQLDSQSLEELPDVIHEKGAFVFS